MVIRPEDLAFESAMQAIKPSGPASSGDNLLGMEIDFDAFLSGAAHQEDQPVLWSDLQVHRHEGDEWLVRASASGLRADADAISGELITIWEGFLRYRYKEAHTISSTPDAVTLRAITQTGTNGLWVTAEIRVSLT